MHPGFRHVDVWIFDLDNTLYPARYSLFDQIDRKMTAFIMRKLGLSQTAANRLRAQYWRAHGTTLAGLMAHHPIDPAEYLADVHDIDLSALPRDPALVQAVRLLPGRRIVHTNGSRQHAQQVVRHLGLEGAFDALFGIEDSDHIPKPHAHAFDRIMTQAGIDPRRAAMFEDSPRNLLVPAERGMVTILVGDGAEPADPAGGAASAHVHFRAAELTRFLMELIQHKA